MTTRSGTSTVRKPPNRLGSLLAEAREGGGAEIPGGLSIRSLAKRAGVSAAQLSRIESGQVRKPRPEILNALSRALNRNPVPLMIVAGHFEKDEACEELRAFFREGAELPEEWGDWATFSLDEVEHLINDPKSSRKDIEAIAADAFRVQETDETLWDDAYSLALARGEDARQLRKLMGIWRAVHERRERLLEYGELLRRIEDLEYKAAAKTEELRAKVATLEGRGQ